LTDNIADLLSQKGFEPINIKSVAVSKTGLTAKSGASIAFVTCENEQCFYVKRGDPWYLAGKYTARFTRPGITINSEMYQEYIVPNTADILFYDKSSAMMYHCDFDTDGEEVRVISFRQFKRWD
jgi:hypothetical protein